MTVRPYPEQQAVEALRKAIEAVEEAATMCTRAQCDGFEVRLGLEQVTQDLKHVLRVVEGT